MRALHFTERFSPTSETFIYDYIAELERQGVDNHIATLRRFNEESRPFPKVTEIEWPNRWDPRRLWNLGSGLIEGYGLEKSKTLSAWPLVRSELKDIAQQVKPDVIHAHFGTAGVIAAPVAEALEISLVTTFYGVDISSRPKEVFWKKQYENLWPKVSGVTVLSEEMRGAARQLGCPDKKINVIHLSRDLNQFSFCPPNRPARRVLFVGRMVPKKAPIDAIRAVHLANERGATLTLDIVGEGPLQEEAHQYVQENNLSGEVTLHGRVSNEKVAEHMQEADIFLLPSKTASDGDREGTPTVLVEAQATGLPCVSTRHAGIPEMIPKDHHDLLVPEGDIEGLTFALGTLADSSVDELEQIAERGREKVNRDFSLSGEVQKLQKLYRPHAKSEV